MDKGRIFKRNPHGTTLHMVFWLAEMTCCQTKYLRSTSWIMLKGPPLVPTCVWLCCMYIRTHIYLFLVR